MPKKKTNKAAAKRLRMTAGGRLRFRRAGGGHLLSCKSRKRKRSIRRGATLSKADTPRIREIMTS